jgi:hypothetical protein
MNTGFQGCHILGMHPIHLELTATTGRLVNANYMNSAYCRIDKAKTGIKRMRSIQKNIVECNGNGKTASKVLERSLNSVDINVIKLSNKPLIYFALL